MKRLRVVQNEALELSSWLEDRAYWGVLLMELRDVMIRTERAGKEQFKTDTGIWIERFLPDCAGTLPGGAVAMPPQDGGQNFPPGGGRRGGGGGGMGGPRRGGGPGFGGPAGIRSGGSNECATITVLCRAVDLSHIGPDANNTFAYLLDKELKGSKLLSTTNTHIFGNLSDPDPVTFPGKTFTVQVLVTPKRPLKM